LAANENRRFSAISIIEQLQRESTCAAVEFWPMITKQTCAVVVAVNAQDDEVTVTYTKYQNTETVHINDVYLLPKSGKVLKKKKGNVSINMIAEAGTAGQCMRYNRLSLRHYDLLCGILYHRPSGPLRRDLCVAR
jgi:hypothetical protein